MIIHAFFLKDGTCRLFVYRNRKITNGLPINFYQFKFNGKDDALRNVDSIISNNKQLSEMVISSFDFYRAFYNKQFGLNQKEIKKELNRISAEEKVYFLDVFRITWDNMKANCYFGKIAA